MSIGNFPGTVTLTDPPREQGVLTSTGMKYGNFNRSIAGNTMIGAGAGYGGGAGRGPGNRFGSPFTGRPRIGSAAGAVGSAGIPTSQRGRAEKFGPEAAMMPTWAVSEALREAPGPDGMSAGLSQSGRYDSMGGLPDPDALPQTTAQPPPIMAQPSQTASPTRLTGPGSARWPRPIGSFARGTSRPIPHGAPFIAGDSTNGKPNEELILPTERGIEVLPLDKMPRLAAGTTPRASKPPPVPLPAPKRPTHGMDDFYRLNPNTPPAADKEAEKLIMNPRLPMPIRVPKLAGGTVHAIDELAPEFADGEVRNDAQGNAWRYDAATGHGRPLNPYLLQPNAPSPNAFKATAQERYADLAQRLSGLRQAGMSAGRARVAAMQAEQNAAPHSDLHATGFRDGGIGYAGKYGTASIGRNVPKRFGVERLDGTTGQYDNLADASAESAADAAQRHVEGLPMNTGRGVGAGVPTAIEELIGVVEPSAIPEVAAAPPMRAALPADRPSTVESRRRDWKMRSKFSPMTAGKAASRGKEALVRRGSNLATNLRSAIDLGLVQPVRDFANNASSAWDILTQ